MEHRVTNKVLLVVIVSYCAVVSGCVGMGLTRTSLDVWHDRQFKDIGISLNLPKDSLLVDTVGVEKWKTDGSGWRTLKFYFHSWGGGKPIVEPLYLVQFRFERLDAKQYAAFREGTQSLAFYWIWKDHHTQEYTNITHFVWRDLGRNVNGWRRDYRAANGDVVVSGVEYIPLDLDDKTMAVDSNAIERVLRSVVVD
jgi:hypothetical protein